MIEVNADGFAFSIGIIGIVRGLSSIKSKRVMVNSHTGVSTEEELAPSAIDPTLRDEFLHWMSKPELADEWAAIGLRQTVLMLKRLEDDLRSNPDMNTAKFGAKVDCLWDLMMSELESCLILEVDDPQAVELMRDPLFLGADVSSHFPSADYDTEEAAKCFALERYTACVYHLMRVAEAGLRCAATALNNPNVDPDKNPSWEKIINAFHGELRKDEKDRSLEWRGKNSFYSEVAGTFQALKTCFRNPTCHLDRKYNKEEAVNVIATLKAFMQHLAKELKE